MTQEEWVKKAWRGKDRVRITVDTHHLHLGEEKPNGSVERTGPLLFVGIGPDHAFLLMIGDHDSFDNGSVSKLMYEKQISRFFGEAGYIGQAVSCFSCLESEFEAGLTERVIPPLMGVGEIAAALRVSKQRASELSRCDVFPPPVADLAAGPVWLASSIGRFLEAWPRQSGRPRKSPQPA
jgi:hypothetical protein